MGTDRRVEGAGIESGEYDQPPTYIIFILIGLAALWMHCVQLTVIPFPLWLRLFFNFSVLNPQLCSSIVFTLFIYPTSECYRYNSTL